jgi:DNA-directed RNA polymerase specialized sigma24 family protein
MATATHQLELLTRCTPIVDGICRACTRGCRCDAEDLRQDLFVKILANPWPFLAVAPEKLASFLGTTARRLHIDLHRRKRELLLATAEAAEAQAAETDAEGNLDVRRAWSGLTERERTTLFATVGEDCTSAALYQRRTRAKRRFLALAGARRRTTLDRVRVAASPRWTFRRTNDA